MILQLKTNTETEMLTALRAVLLSDEEGDLITATHDYWCNLIGTKYELTGQMISDGEGGEYPERAPIAGYFAELTVKYFDSYSTLTPLVQNADVIAEYNAQQALNNRTEYTTANEEVKVNGNEVQGLSSVYFGIAGDALHFSLDIVNDANEVQAQIDQVGLGYPPVLALPIVKVGGGSVIIDEVYATTTIANGVMSATLNSGVLTSGNWMLLEDRINNSLAEIGADWKIEMPDISFRMGS